MAAKVFNRATLPEIRPEVDLLPTLLPCTAPYFLHGDAAAPYGPETELNRHGPKYSSIKGLCHSDHVRGRGAWTQSTQIRAG